MRHIPRLFQLGDCKQCDGTHNPICPSCGVVSETCAHALTCDEVDGAYRYYWLLSVKAARDAFCYVDSMHR
eukprot:scaffold5143_cov139-Skeletonema_marinoi.AAC.14